MVRSYHAVARGLQDHCHEVQEVDIVLDHQDGRRLSLSRSPLHASRLAQVVLDAQPCHDAPAVAVRLAAHERTGFGATHGGPTRYREIAWHNGCSRAPT